MGKSEAYELEGVLREVADKGSLTIALKKLLRLLEKGNRAAGTWKSLLDAWEEIGEGRSHLYITELPWEVILLSRTFLVPVKNWANE